MIATQLRSRVRSAVALVGAGALALALVIAPPTPAAVAAGPRAVPSTVLTVSPAAAMAALRQLAGPGAAGAGAAGPVTENPPGNGSTEAPAAAPVSPALPTFSLPTPIEVIWAVVGPLATNPITAPLVVGVALGGFFFLVGTAAFAITVCPVCTPIYQSVLNLVVTFFTGAPPLGSAAAAPTGEDLAGVEPAAAEMNVTEPTVSDPVDEPSALATESSTSTQEEAKAASTEEEASATENVADEETADELSAETTESEAAEEVATDEDVDEPAATETDGSVDNEVDEAIGSVPADDAATGSAPSDDDSTGDDPASE
ncbi:hypothetical protein H7I53_09770 [Mycolicibacterium pulveris]|uniref:Uncharacterized protein n=1 Tax=Mycolicibacterium pulveris TaxID=36813 RepID=A0A7I7UM21_MYCPV|nr:hypothetical protein [Mycolicibacterium pulveris]MCV6980507.1 hypothetical protein [Mycolicibacterium pulveris]BBY81901.1 hypothetical protein MPUL_30590 [Mycolicibacterium pulveris]